MLKVYTLNDVPNKSQLMFKKQKDKGGKLVLKRTGLALFFNRIVARRKSIPLVPPVVNSSEIQVLFAELLLVAKKRTTKLIQNG
jgi:hypothetical protein